jgi:hypothetical protein
VRVVGGVYILIRVVLFGCRVRAFGIDELVWRWTLGNVIVLDA